MVDDDDELLVAGLELLDDWDDELLKDDGVEDDNELIDELLGDEDEDEFVEELLEELVAGLEDD